MPQVALARTPSTATVVLGAMAWGYRKVTGQLPPTFNSILYPTAQSALETSSWRAMWNNNAGNVTTAKPVTDNWVSLAQLSSATAGLRFKAYKNLGDGCADMLTWLYKRGVLPYGDNGDLTGYVNALAAHDYAGAPGQPGSADYGVYQADMAGLINQYRNVVPTTYSSGIGLLPSLMIGAGVVGLGAVATWYFAPDIVKGLLGEGASESDEASEADEEDRENPVEYGEEEEEEADELAVPESTEVQSLLFSRKEGWTVPKARTWIRSHRQYHFGKVDVTDNYVRARQESPSHFKKDSFRTITFGKGIRAVVARR